MAKHERTLAAIQRWMLSVITHPRGVEAGAASDEARSHLPIDPDQLEQLIAPSSKLSSADRLSVYADAYYARLIEVMRVTFSTLRRAIGEEAFDELAFGYLRAHPSRSYSLDPLGDRFAEYLEATRPDDADWPDFVIDLAKLDWAINQVFDGPGVEDAATLDAEALRSIDPADWAHARLIASPCLRLLRFRYPVNAYFTMLRRTPDDQPPPPPPAPGEQFVALSRLNYIVYRYTLSPFEHDLLESLTNGATIGEAIEHAAARCEDINDEQLASMLHTAFATWTKGRFFLRIEMPAEA